MSEENIHELEIDYDEEDSDETSDEEYEDNSETDLEGDDDETIANNVQDSVKSVASLIAHNEAYQVLIIKLTKKVGQLLQNNRDQQRKLKQVINNGVVQGLSTSRVLRSEFNPPYFHDVFGMVPVANVESVAITNESPLDVLMREPAPWSNEELVTLRDAVSCQVIEKKTEEVEAKKQTLRYKIKNYHAEDGIEQLRKWKVEFEAVQKRLDYLKSLPIDELLENAKFEELDWARISVKDFGGTRTIMQLKMKWMNDQSPRWNKDPWTEEEIESLKSITQSPWINWDFVSEKLKSKRSPFQCFEKFMEIQKQNREKRPWTTSEDEKLLSLIQTFKFGETINWNRVAAHMPGRNNMQCKIRYTRSLDRTLKRGRWGEAEDLLLTSAVNKYGPQDWDRIASQVPGRSSLQCRARWINCLDYKKRNAPWSVDEDEAVLIGVKVFGRNQFSKISKLLPGRNSYDIKNRVRTLLRWKIVALLECQGNRQSLSVPKRNDSARIKKFGEIARLSNNMNKRGIMLHKRMGYGTFVVSEDGECDVDYSQMKVEMCNKFGYHYIARKGRWCRLAKNPNEYGSNELMEEIKRLPDDKKRILERFLEERDDREGRLENAEIDEEEEEAVMARVSQLMADNLEVDEKDIEWFHKNTLSRKLTTKKRASVNKALKSAKKRRRTSKRNAVRSDFGMYISDLAPTRYSVSDRMADEFCYNVNKLPKCERRGFILNQMADCVAREMDTQTKRAFAKIPREIPSTRVVDYLQKELSVERCSLAISNSSENPAKYTLDMKNLFSSVLPPAAPTLNCLLYYKEQVRRSLMADASRLFTRAPDQGNIASDTLSDGILDIKLSEQIASSREYLVLKSRIFKLFVWPMILKKSLENGESIELREKLRAMNAKRRTQLIKNMESKGLSVKERAYQWGTVDPDPGLFDKDPNDGLLKELNHGRPCPDYFNPKLSRKDVLESPRKAVKARRKNFKTQPGTLGHVILGESMTIRAAPSVARSYTPRWARTSNALFDVNMMKAEDVNKLTLKDLMLLDETERRKVASIIRSNAKKSQEPQAGSSNEP